jgi:sterol desaturase/sphingolipid hydroxylase (fatty acid hydroxylase superfamily)
MTLVNVVSARIGVDPLAFDLGFAIFLKYNDFIHANVKLRFPGPLKYIFVSPFMHQWHHAVEEEAWGKNVGVVFAWNDWLLGTFYHPKEFATKFGLTVPDAEKVPESYLRQLVYPAQYAWVRLRNRRAATQTNP